MTWQQIPFVRLLIPFLFGICFYNWWGANSLSWLSQLLIQLILLTVLAIGIPKDRPSISTIRIWGIWLFLPLSQMGYLMSYIQDDRNNTTHIQQQLLPKATYLATISSIPKINLKSIRTTLSIEGLQSTQNKLTACSGEVLAYFQLDTISSRLNYGDQILFQAAVKPLTQPLNPKAFDQRSYYHPKNIYHQTYLPTQQWVKINTNQNKSLYQFIHACKGQLLKILQQHLPSPNEYAVAAALILGAKDQLNKEIRNAYADTGAMHVLAVSGLHIGILAGLISFLLGLIRSENRKWKKVKTLLLLSLLWGFALLTGASASVLRACTMFSFILVGQLLGRKINVYNSLAASAFLLLCINPFLLFDVGFQLSYLALIGIIYLHPKIYKFWYIEHTVGNWIWKGLALSIAAQISTFPISLYYFHQFPVFFWLSGVVVTAAAGLILGIGLCLFLLYFVPVLSTALGYLLYAAVWLMNSLIFAIQQLPGAVWDGFWLESWQMWSWYGLIISTIYLLSKRQLKWAFIPLSFCTILLGHHALQRYDQSQQVQFCIYNHRKNTLFSYITGRNCITWADSNLIGTPQMQYSQQNHLWSMGINDHQIYSLEDSIQTNKVHYRNKKGQFFRQRLALYTPQSTLQQSHAILEVDYVLVQGNPKLKSIRQIEQLYFYKKLLFDASNSPWKIKQWVKECQALNIDFVDISSEGAWVIDW
ncbi:ComEC/Rec2 family competence protein [Aureispira anguillae]|uniref:ComEC family competence protein n=1 Tax=Aureispira anguillae TaxID=2864201 RepID=A0A915YES8_9BACT|nr:ComEC/Rec2 family competence protein [Aureispira anguillae]BDS11671.1 ComEC family competence protein [Aureispira anguillae]